MGKKQHSKDRMFITKTEWATEWGGAKSKETSTPFKRLPFYCCSLTFTPFEDPVCTADGSVFDIMNILPYMKKYGKHPVTGGPLKQEDLIPLTFHKNSDGEYHCPVLNKVFTEFTHIVAVKTTGNVFSYEAIKELNLKTKNWKELLTDEPFTKDDLITIQNPNALDSKALLDFDHVKNSLKLDDEDLRRMKEDPLYNINVSGDIKQMLQELGTEKGKLAALHGGGGSKAQNERAAALAAILAARTRVKEDSKSSWKMTASKPVSRMISHVIVDLDGTLVNTDGIVTEVLKELLIKYGKKWNTKGIHKIVGKTPLEAATVVVEDYGLPCMPEEFMSTFTPMFSSQLCNIKALPGANRLIKHLKSKGVPLGLASNSPKSNIEAKISYHHGWKDSFGAIVGGDEVVMGKPSPKIFLEAARRMNADPSNCLVIEDSLPGVMAGKAAGMEVVAVPSLPKQSASFTSADEVINSLLDLHPEKWGLPPFEDWIEGTLPIEPWYIGGPVIKGFGRGSKVLGIPTANLPAENFSALLSEHTSGVYFGWAALATRGIYKMVMSIGWNPYFDNTEKTIEPWLLHEFSEDFYGEELRLAIVGYIRPEANFPSLESLIARIHEDGRVAEKALDLPIYACYKDSPYLRNS